jgi:hypothetical protein
VGHQAKNCRSTVLDPEIAFTAASEASIETHAGEVVIAADAARQAGLELSEAADLPSAEQLAGQVGLALEEGQLVEEVDDQDMAVVEFRRAPQMSLATLSDSRIEL